MECYLFLNEKSSNVNELVVSETELRLSVINFVQCLIKLNSLNHSVRLLHFGEISSLSIGACSLASLLNIPNAREYWNRIRLAFVNGNVLYGEKLEEIESCQFLQIGDDSCRGALMALINDSLMMSFNINRDYLSHQIDGFHYVLADDKSSEVKVLNVYEKDIPFIISDKIENFGLLGNTSTTIHSNDAFIVQMYINDHNPPHVHVYSSGRKSNILARVNIKNNELMEGSEEVQPIRKELMKWIEENKDDLITSWQLCQQGKYPRKIS